MASLSRLAFAVAALFALSCSSTAGPKEETAIGRTSSAIIGGTPDTTHQAVVFTYAHISTGSVTCSGTIIKVDPVTHIGYVLTAAHCVLPAAEAPSLIVLGDDFTQPSSRQFAVLDSEPNPLWDGMTPANDFGIVRFLAASAATPTMPILSAADEDLVAVGTEITAVGYGSTTDAMMSTNKVRNEITRPLLTVDDMLLTYSIATGGDCYGDSGGPWLVTVGGTEYIAGVDSFITVGVATPTSCDGDAGANRISAAAVQPWLDAALTKDAPAPSCDLCEKTAISGDEPCARPETACGGDAVCEDYVDCLLANRSPVFKMQCDLKFPASVPIVAACVAAQCASICAPETPDAGTDGSADAGDSDGSAAGGSGGRGGGGVGGGGSGGSASRVAVVDSTPQSDSGCNATGRPSDAREALLVLGALAGVAFARRSRSRRRRTSR